MGFNTYNALSATKKATVTTYYTSIVDDYVLDIIKAGVNENTLAFETDEVAGVNGESWFPKKSQCPDLYKLVQQAILE